jgi:uncharacterized protein (DUF1499 family)
MALRWFNFCWFNFFMLQAPMIRTLIALAFTFVLWLGAADPAHASIFSFRGDRPTNLGVNQGRFAACPGTPNCVNSQATDGHQIAPLAFSGDGAAAMAKVKQAIAALPGSAIISDAGNYINVEFTSALMGFVDDVEFYCDDAAGVIQVRSASRLGESDLGVNAKRVEAIRSALL